MGKTARNLYACLLALTLAGSTGLRAQEQKPAATGVGLNTTRYENNFSTETASLNIFNVNDGELWVVGGQNYNFAKNDFDAGLKYVKGKNLFRGTVATRKSDSKENLSYGLDWDAAVVSPQPIQVSLLGDLSYVNENIDFGIGPKITFSENHSVFFLYSNRNNAHSYRAGYMFLDEKRLASVFVNYPEGKDPDYEAFFGGSDRRFQLSYNAADRKASSINIISFGNKNLPDYAAKGFFASQIILTDRSVEDSDFTMYFPAQFFLDPKGGISGILRFNAVYNTKDWSLDSGLLDGAVIFRTHENDGIILTVNVDRNDEKKYYGGGIGYKFSHFTPIIKYQASDRKVFTVDASFSY